LHVRLGPPLRHDAEVWFAQFSLNGESLVTASLDNSAKIWSTNGNLMAVLQHSAPVEYAEFSPNGSKVVTASGDRTARIWKAATGQQLTEPLEHSEVVLTAHFSSDGLRVITASMDRTAQVWDVATGLKLGDPFRHDDWVVSANFSPDGRQAITASSDKSAKIWPVPVALPPIPPWLPDLAEAVAGQRLNADRIPEPVSWAENAALKARLKRTALSDPHIELVNPLLGESILPSVRAQANTYDFLNR
jgi:WD40 repeat protein